MKVILLEDVKSLGKKGQLVEVNAGYARNFILPKKLGVEATSKNINDLKLQKAHEDKVAAEQLAAAKALAEEKGLMKEFALYELVESLAGQMIKEQRNLQKNVCANVDFYSGFVYSMLGIPQELFTPIFAIARMPGWSAHRLEELTNANKIIRPAYKYVGHHTEFETMEERSAEKITDEDVKEEPEKCKKEEKGKK